MKACFECGRPLEPIELTSGNHTWTHHPHCWHPDTEEVYGTEMSIERALEIAQGYGEYLMDQADDQQAVVEELQELLN